MQRSLRWATMWLAPIVAVGAAGAAGGYSGAAALFHAEEVAVVYPAGPGEDVEVNRLSAQRRAAFLHEVHGVEARVVADDAANAEILGLDLLLLGWGNRLLATAEMPRPVVERDGGRSVLGLFDLDAGEDVFFSAASPHAEDRWLFFWSRIDLEQDRFSVLPFEGSTWAVFRGYRVERQGMFVPGPDWPPRRDGMAEKTHSRRPPPASRRSEHYTAHYDPAAIAGGRVGAILEAREKAWAAATRALGTPEPPFRIELYLYADETRKTSESGVSDAVHSVPWNRELHMVERLALLPAPHEEIHLLARALLGPCYLSALYEGLAIDSEQTGAPMERAVNAGVLRDQGKMPPIDVLLDEEGFRRAGKDGSGFPAAALLVHWLRNVRAPERFAEFYVRRDLSAATLAAELDVSPSDLQRTFDDWLQALSRGAGAEVAYRQARAQAEHRRRTGDVEGAVGALERALEIKPGDLPTLLRLSSALTDAGRYDDAEERLKELLKATEAPDKSHLAGFVYYRLGKLYDIQGKPEQAIEALERALALPDHNEVHKRVRETIAARGGAGDGS